MFCRPFLPADKLPENAMQWFRREKTVLKLTFLLMSDFFQRKPFGLLSLSFISLFQQRTNMGEVFYYQKYAKPFESSVYHTKLRNISTAARAITGGRLDKVGRIESHNYHKRQVKYRKSSTLIISDSIVKGLRGCIWMWRYMDVWDRYFEKHTVNLGIRGEKVEDVIWRIGNLDVNREVRFVVLICGTNNIDKNVPAYIVKDIKYAIQLGICKFYNCKVIVSGILPWCYSPVIRRNKIRLVNIRIKYAVGKMNNNDVIYLDPDHTRTTSGGILNTNL